MPTPPRWLLAVPDAIRQLEALDRDLLTRRDVERLFGVSRARAAQLFALFAEVERDLISERTREGLAKARPSGRKLGRPEGLAGRLTTRRQGG